MYDFDSEAKKVIDLRDTLVKHADEAKLLSIDAASLQPSLAQFQQRYKRFVIEKRLQKDRDTTRDQQQLAKHGRLDLLSDEYLEERAEEEDNDKLRAAFDLSGVESKVILQVDAVGGGNVQAPTSAMNVSSTTTTPVPTSTGTNTSTPVPATSSFTQADQPMYGDDDCMIIREAPVAKVISLPSSPSPSPVATTQSPQQVPQYSDHAPDGEVEDDEEDDDMPPKKKRLSKKQREKRKLQQQQQLMLQYQLRQQLMGQVNTPLDPSMQPPLPNQPAPPAPGTQQPPYPFPFPPFAPNYNFNMPPMPPVMPPVMPPMPPGMPPMPFWPQGTTFPPPQPKKNTPDPNDSNEVYGQPSYTDN